jgi:hypothetical protein
MKNLYVIHELTNYAVDLLNNVGGDFKLFPCREYYKGKATKERIRFTVAIKKGSPNIVLDADKLQRMYLYQLIDEAKEKGYKLYTLSFRFM